MSRTLTIRKREMGDAPPASKRVPRGDTTMNAVSPKSYPIHSPTSTCPFCDTDLCDTCGGCHGDCPEYHRCGCWEIRDVTGQIIDLIAARRCLSCGETAPEVFFSSGICPDCLSIVQPCEAVW
jgi:hypothetical protein